MDCDAVHPAVHPILSTLFYYILDSYIDRTVEDSNNNIKLGRGNIKTYYKYKYAHVIYGVLYEKRVFCCPCCPPPVK